MGVQVSWYSTLSPCSPWQTRPCLRNASRKADTEPGSPILSPTYLCCSSRQIWGSIEYLERNDSLYKYFMCENRVKVSSEKTKRTFGHFAVGGICKFMHASVRISHCSDNPNRDVRILRARKSMQQGVIIVKHSNGDVTLQSLCDDPIHFVDEPERHIRAMQEVRRYRPLMSLLKPVTGKAVLH